MRFKPISALATATLAFLSSIPLLAEVSLDPSSSTLSIIGNGVSLTNARPRVQLLIGKDRKRLDWKPTGAGSLERKPLATPLGKSDTVTVSWQHPDGYILKWHIARLQERDGCSLRCELQNNSPTNVRIRRFHVLDVPNGSLTLEGDPNHWMAASRYLKYARYYDSVADLQKRGQPSNDNRKNAKMLREASFDEDFTLYTDHGKRGLSISAVGDTSFIWAHLQVPENGKLGFDVTSEMTGVLVQPGESRSSETLLALLTPWHDAGLDAVKWISSVIKPLNTKPIFGWCSWYCAAMHVTQEHCLDTAEFVAKNRDRYPFDTIQVDEGWQIGRHCWHANGKFDKGMTHLASSIQQAGSMPGVWLSPATPNSERIADGKLYNFSTTGEGSAVRSFDPSWYIGHSLGKPAVSGLDPSSPGAREYMIGELRRLTYQGYTYFKTDFSLVGNMESGYHDPKLTHFQAQRSLYSAFREGVGDGYLLACNGGPTRVVLGLADATRMGTDSGQKWCFSYRPNEFGKPDDVHGSWFPILQIGCASTYSHLIAVDPDVSRVDALGNAKLDPRFPGKHQTPPNYQSMETVQTFHGFLSLYGGLMMISDLIYDEHYQQDKRLRMVEIMHPPTPDKGWNFAGGSDILNRQFGFNAQRPWGNWVSMVVWNPDHKNKADLAINHAPLENIGKRFHLWSFWDENYLGVQDSSYRFKDVAKYHSRLIRLTPITPNGEPVLIGSNLHMSMGSAEIQNVSNSPNGITIDLVPSAGALEGQLVIHSRQPLELLKATGCQAFVMTSGPQVHTVVITARDRNAKQSIQLANGNPPHTFKQIQSDPLLAKKWKTGSMLGLK